MPYFQVPDDRRFSNSTSGLKNWPANPQGYRLFIEGPGSPERIGIHTGQEITLQQVGFDSSGKLPIVWSDKLNVAQPLGVVGGAKGDRQTFKVLGKNPGSALLTAKDAAGKDVAGPINIVVGKYEYHPGMVVDLIAEIGRGNDSLKLLAIQRMLYYNRPDDSHINRDNIFEQHAPANDHVKYGNMACGIVAKFRGDQIFGNMTEVFYDNPYHEPLTGPVTKRSDVKYKAKTISSLQTQLAAMLADGKPVRVGVLDGPINMGTVYNKQGQLVYFPRNLVAYHAGGHSVLIVGCNEGITKFLYIDPWGSGSQMEYLGGITGNKAPGKCQQLGMFEFVKDNDRLVSPADAGRWNLMRTTMDTEGTFNRGEGNYLEVVAGPWRF